MYKNIISILLSLTIISSCSLNSGDKVDLIPVSYTWVIHSWVISSWVSYSGSFWSKITSNEDISNSPGVQKMIEIQKNQWENGILATDCKSLPDKEWRDFCMSQQNKLQETIKNTVTWEWSIKKWGEFISTMDCKVIYSEIGQKYCQEYQAGLKKK